MGAGDRVTARGRKWWRSLALGAALLIGLGVAGELWIATTALPSLEVELAVEVLDSEGELLRAFTVADGRWRLSVEVADVDPGYLAMLLAYEDKRFYAHRGVDLLAVARAAYQAVLGRGVVSGGSTITMQVARLLEEGSTGSLRGKLRQVRVALKLERALSKGEILGLYLRLAPMGGNLEGVRAGSLAWFGKEPTRLTEAEAALLVALPQAPAARAPDAHPAAAAAARERVIRRVAKVGLISEDAARAALSEAMPARRRPFPSLAPHLADRLKVAEPSELVHRTTLDGELQGAVEELARTALVGLPEQVTVALMVAEVRSGSVLATVGSAEYTSEARKGFVDMTQAVRSPGSTLKPLVYGLAFSAGLAHPETLMDDRPEEFGGYAPLNFDGYFRGPVTAREALQASLNLPVVSLTEALGPARLLRALEEAGTLAVVPGDVPGLAIALGGIGVNLEGLVQLYAAIAAGGEVKTLHYSLPEEGLLQGRSELMTPSAAWHVSDVLSAAPRAAHLPRWPLAFKTGTSHGNRDALAIGYDGEHVVGVWVGRADGSPVPGLLGAEAAAPLLFEVFARLRGPVPLADPPPGTLRVSATAELPANLRRFGVREAELTDAPQLTFPPDGAVLEPLAGGVPVRVERGEAPFTWFVNGVPLVPVTFEREARLDLGEGGFVALTVVDAHGRAARASIELR